MASSEPQPIDREFLAQLRRMGTIEGISTLVLFFVAMPLKYLGGVPMAVTIVGPIHGVLFLILAAMCAIAVERVPIGRGLGAAGICAAVVPFGPFVVDRWLARVAKAPAGA